MKNRMGSSRLAASSTAALAFTALLASGACMLEEVDSDAIRTRGMYVEMLAIAPGDGTTLVRVNLTVGGASGTRIELTGGDQLVTEVDETVTELSRRGRGRYEQRLQFESPGEIVVRLERVEEDDSAQGVAVLPEPFAMQLETDDSAGIDRASNAVVSWQDPGEQGANIKWSVEGDCIWTESGITPDDGVFTLTPERIRVRPTKRGEECAVRVTLDRERSGAVDPVFVPGSNFRAIQRRAISFLSTPTADELGAQVEVASELEEELSSEEETE